MALTAAIPEGLLVYDIVNLDVPRQD